MTEIICEKAQTLNLLDKYLKINVFNILKELKEIRKITHTQNKNLNKEIEIMKMSQKKFFLKNSFCKFFLFIDILILTSKGNYLGK